MSLTLQEVITNNPFVNNKCKFKNILRGVIKLKINSEQLNTESHKRCNIARDTLFCDELKDDMIILQAPISFNEILPNSNTDLINNDKLADIECGRFEKTNNNYIFNYEYLSKNIQYCIQMNKIIFIMFIFKEYAADEVLDKNKVKLQYSTHSTCMIMVPDKLNKNNYSAYYINSHGRDMDDTDIYKRIRSNKRTFNVKFSKPAEIIFIENLINYWTTMEYNESETLNIQWNNTKEYTYLDTDLQSGDGHGVCFAFPQIILHYFGYYYNTKQVFNTEWGNITINSLKDLLRDGKLNILVKSAFINYNPRYKKKFLESLEITYENSEDDELEKVVINENTNFIKCMVFHLTNYLNQIN